MKNNCNRVYKTTHYFFKRKIKGGGAIHANLLYRYKSCGNLTKIFYFTTMFKNLFWVTG